MLMPSRAIPREGAAVEDLAVLDVVVAGTGHVSNYEGANEEAQTAISSAMVAAGGEVDKAREMGADRARRLLDVAACCCVSVGAEWSRAVLVRLHWRAARQV